MPRFEKIDRYFLSLAMGLFAAAGCDPEPDSEAIQEEQHRPAGGEPFACVEGPCDPPAVLDEFSELDLDYAEMNATGAGGGCYNACNCTRGLLCQKLPGQQKGICSALNFSPPPPPSTCYASCQCPFGQACEFNGSTYGVCRAPKATCTSDCDCGVAYVCADGECQPDFGPFPACRCDKHCPVGTHCVNGGCQ